MNRLQSLRHHRPVAGTRAFAPALQSMSLKAGADAGGECRGSSDDLRSPPGKCGA
ncbi:MAG: hypothetical protein ACTHL8_15495 [Burkholderiaceae bacterium]